MLVLQSRVQILSFIPGAFCGAAVTAWAAPADPKGYLMVAVALVAGAVLGYISEMGAGMIAKKAWSETRRPTESWAGASCRSGTATAVIRATARPAPVSRGAS